jgi:probable metal-binding protein
MDALVSSREPVFGHDLLFLLEQMGGKASVEALRNAAAGAFGADAVYGNCHGGRFSFHEVLAFLASRGKLELRGDEVFLGAEPACSGH